MPVNSVPSDDSGTNSGTVSAFKADVSGVLVEQSFFMQGVQD